MQAEKSRGDAEPFDRFECLNCHTTIVEAPEDVRGPDGDVS